MHGSVSSARIVESFQPRCSLSAPVSFLSSLTLIMHSMQYIFSFQESHSRNMLQNDSENRRSDCQCQGCCIHIKKNKSLYHCKIISPYLFLILSIKMEHKKLINSTKSLKLKHHFAFVTNFNII